MNWYDNPRNLGTLAKYLSDHYYSTSEIAYAMEKPWKWQNEFEKAKAYLKED